LPISLSLKFLEVVVDTIQAGIDGLFELGQPVMHGLELRWLKAVQPTPAFCPGFDESNLAQDSKVLRDLWLGHREGVDDRSDRFLPREERAQNGATVRFCDGIEDIGRR
jgi:hypothetical protein